VEALIEAVAGDFGVALRVVFDEGYGDLLVGFALHHAMRSGTI
jgi:hypothetical protein